MKRKAEDLGIQEMAKKKKRRGLILRLLSCSDA
jgi:hypothetical protein